VSEQLLNSLQWCSCDKCSVMLLTGAVDIVLAVVVTGIAENGLQQVGVAVVNSWNCSCCGRERSGSRSHRSYVERKLINGLVICDQNTNLNPKYN
jgi:hypothetical protein